MRCTMIGRRLISFAHLDLCISSPAWLWLSTAGFQRDCPVRLHKVREGLPLLCLHYYHGDPSNID